ncbi:MAG TPA: EthD family reductase [Actinomycetes bacterium]|nr:EthD family reductase [Actinomycetes bacterium]
MIKRLTAWRVRPGLDLNQAIARWSSTRHVELVLAVPGVLRYAQDRCVPGPDGSGPPYAGMGEIWFESMATATAAVATPEWQKVLTDAATFMDMSTVVAAYAEVQRA